MGDFTFNGTGISLAGVRDLTKEEKEDLIKYLPKKSPFQNKDDTYNPKIATRSVVMVFLPVTPLETIIFNYVNEDYIPFPKSRQYIIFHYPAGKGKILWSHVKSSPIFYVYPVLVILMVIILIISQIV